MTTPAARHDQPAASPSPRDHLADAIAVLEGIDLAALSRSPATEDAGNRVALALGYLRAAVERQKDATIIERVRDAVGVPQPESWPKRSKVHLDRARRLI
jgi:hypothetical protein